MSALLAGSRQLFLANEINVYPGSQILILDNLQRIIVLLTQKLSLSSQKYGSGIRDLEKNLFLIPDPGVKKATALGSATLKKNSAQPVKNLAIKKILSFYNSINFKLIFF
jgi:hypothetical protein